VKYRWVNGIVTNPEVVSVIQLPFIFKNKTTDYFRAVLYDFSNKLNTNVV